MNPNLHQRRVIQTALGAVILSILFPPFSWEDRATDYGFLLGKSFGVINFGHLLIEWVAIGIVAAGFWFYFQEKK